MKKTIIIALTLANLLIAKDTVIETTSGWELVFTTDDFDDNVKKCSLVSKNYAKKDIAGLVITNINNQNERQVISSSGSFLGSQLVYRVDKNDSVYLNGYTIEANKDYDNLVTAFKNGKEVKIKVTPKNQFANTATDTISLEGFGRLYKLAETCNYK